MAAVDSTDRRDFIVNINGQESGAVGATGSSSNAEGGNIWKESSYDFWDGEKGKNDKKGDDEDEDGGSFHFRQRGERRHSSAELSDPPSKLIGQFLHKQRASGDEISLDVELNMAELQSNTPPRPATASNTPRRGLTTISESSSPVKTKVKADAVRRRQNRTSLGGSSDEEGRNRDEAEVLKCGSKKPMLSRNKTKSRLQDPPTPTHPAIDKTEMKSGRRSGIFKSGFLGKSPKAGTPGRNGFEEEEEEDPFLDEDLPEEFKRDKLSFWVFLEWISLVLIVTSLVCSLTIHNLQRKTWWKLDLWKWEVTVLVLICGRLVSSWIVRIIVFLVEKNFTWRKRVLYFVYGVRKSVQNCLWLGLVLLAWHFLFDKKVERETRSTALRYVTRVLVCLLVALIIWLVKTILVKVLASSFHMSTYFDRIQESLFTQYVIETLSGPPLMEIQRMEEEEQQVAEDVKSLEKLAGAKLPPALKATVKSFMKVGKSPGLNRIGSKRGEDGEGIRIDQLKRMNTKNVSAWNMKRLMNIILKGAISTLDQNMQDTTQEDEDATHIRSEYEAKCAARKIFHNVTEPGSRYIYLEDFLRFLCEEEAERAMALFEGASESDKISKSCLKNWVVKAFRERRALALTLNDTKTAVDRLHRIINVVIGIIIIIIWLLILGIATTRFLLVLSSQLLLVAFVFGNSCKTIFEAIIFLFVMHPFDVGDRCEIDGVQLVVEEMNILTTVFLRYDNQKIIYPNSVLGTKPIANYYRSPDMGDAVEFCVHIATPPEKITAIKQRILSYVDNKKDYWYPAPMIVFLSMDDLNSVKIAVWLTHRMNHHLASVRDSLSLSSSCSAQLSHQLIFSPQTNICSHLCFLSFLSHISFSIFPISLQHLHSNLRPLFHYKANCFRNSSHLFLPHHCFREGERKRAQLSDGEEYSRTKQALCNCLDQKVNVRRSLQVQETVEDHQSFALEEEEQQLSTPSLLQDTTIPFLQMLQQSEDPSPFLSFKDPSFLALLSLQTLEKPWELENYLPHEVPEFHSPIHSETNHYYHNPSLEGVNEAISNQELPFNPLENARSRRKRKNNNLASLMTREKRKRRRTKPTKNIEEIESQRMTHIAVERNRRRQMNVHLNSLRSIIPSSYIQRGDQASIVGGAIDFVKILEQQLQSLEAQKRSQQSDDNKEQIPEDNSLRNISSNKLRASNKEEQSSKLKIEATVIESHVNLKIQCTRKQGQLLRSIILLEKLRFTVLHLNITSPTNTSVSYSFNLKMEDECNLGSADEITAAIRQIFDS